MKMKASNSSLRPSLEEFRTIKPGDLVSVIDHTNWYAVMCPKDDPRPVLLIGSDGTKWDLDKIRYGFRFKCNTAYLVVDVAGKQSSNYVYGSYYVIAITSAGFAWVAWEATDKIHKSV